MGGGVFTISSLYHHGIKGQKWGVKNGPPYPLKNNVRYRGASEQPHVRLKDGGHDVNNKSEAWAAAFFAAGGAASLAAAVANPIIPISPTTGVTLTPTGRAEAAVAGTLQLALASIMVGQEFVALHRNKKYAQEREKSETDTETGLKRIPESSNLSEQEDLKRVNPSYLDWNTDSKNNCMLCTTTYEMRRRGYDVTAQKDATGYPDSAVKNWFPDAKIESIPKQKGSSFSKSIIAELEKQPEGSRGNLMVNVLGMGGHSLFYEIQNGKVVIRDAQVAKTYNEFDFLNLDSCTSGTYARLDNVEFDRKGIKEACYS